MKKLIVLTFLLIPLTVQAASRRVLGLYKSSAGETAARNNIHTSLELPLESLGLRVDYHDIDQGFPDDSAMRAYRGVITYFEGPDINEPNNYALWAEHQIRHGRKMVIFGEYGAFRDARSGEFISHASANRVFEAMGLRYDGFWTLNRKLIEPVFIHPQMLSFEEPLRDDQLGAFQLIRSLNSGNTSYLTLARTDLPNSTSTLVAITNGGGVALEPYLFYRFRQAGVNKQRWHLDPVRFLEQALDIERAPRLVLSSLNGRRVWMAHVDGDGLVTPSNLKGLCGDVIDKKVFKAYGLPFTAAIVTSDVSTGTAGAAILEKIRGRSNVSLASHSNSHPEDWTTASVDLKKEIDGSLRELELDPPLIAWSGNANPPPAAFERLERFGGENINGFNGPGGFIGRWDDLYTSRSNISPAVTQVGDYPQYNHRAANDYGLQNGYENILQTLKNIESSEWDIPLHVYFHFYAGQNTTTLAAVTNVINWSLARPISPVTIHEYIMMVRDFRNARLNQTGPSEFRVQNTGWARTVFFPWSGRHVDMEKATGVLGYQRADKGLLVFLDESTDHRIPLTDTAPQGRYVLASASGWVEKWTQSGEEVSFHARGTGPKKFTLRTPRSASFFKVEWQKPTDVLLKPRSEIVLSSGGSVDINIKETSDILVTVHPAGPLEAASTAGGELIFGAFLAVFVLWFMKNKAKALL